MTRLHRSEAQANADALARRGSPYAPEHHVSTTNAWDWRKREPRDLREAVRYVRRAYEDEVPRRMTEGANSIGDDGTPRFAPQAEAYIFGSDSAVTGTMGEVVTFYRTPFRALLAEMEQDRALSTRKHAAIVRWVTMGGQDPEVAAMTEGVPDWCTRRIAMDALTLFIRRLSDVKVAVAKEHAAA